MTTVAPLGEEKDTLSPGLLVEFLLFRCNCYWLQEVHITGCLTLTSLRTALGGARAGGSMGLGAGPRPLASAERLRCLCYMDNYTYSLWIQKYEQGIEAR